MKKKTAICIGSTGQDGSYLCEFLLKKGYRVIGTKRRTSTINTERIDGIFDHPDFTLKYFDLNDSSAIWNLINDYKPDELYNLAAQSHVKVSFEVPEHTVDGIAMGTLRILNALVTLSPETKFYNAASSEMFGRNTNIPHNEDSRFMPASPYGCAKTFAFNLVQNYRNAYGLFACSGILYNHCSPRRGRTFVTRKISQAAARIKLGLQDKLYLGNLNAKRDWGWAPDYVECMWKMLQQDTPEDYVIATGETHTVQQYLEEVFRCAGLNPHEYVEIDKRLFRPEEVPLLLGDSTKAQKKLNWKPKNKFSDIARKMFKADLEMVKKQLNKGDE